MNELQSEASLIKLFNYVHPAIFTSFNDIEIVELQAFETFIAVEDQVLAAPTIIRYDGESSLFVYENSSGSVLRLDTNGEVIREYSRRGRGPGENLFANNFFLTEYSLFIIDMWQFFIHKYDLDGEFNSSLNYGEMGYIPSAPLPPASPTVLRSENINNYPFVTPNGDVMLSPVKTGETVESIYTLYDWEGNHISGIGEVPEGSSFILDTDQLRADILNREVPAFYKSNVFPVSNTENQDEFFLVYSSIPIIAKYNDSGRKLWESEVIGIPEIDSVATHFYEVMERLQQSDPSNRIALRYYHSGVSSPDGYLYLALTTSNSLWIHRFNPNGELTRRYRMESDEVGLLAIFDIDFNEDRIFVVTEESEIRVYHF